MADTAAWKKRDTYDKRVSYNSTVTISQTPFSRIKNDVGYLDLFADPTRHQPPGKPHLMTIISGAYGSLPRTIVTRSTANNLVLNKDLCKAIDEYTKLKSTKSDLHYSSSGKSGSEEASNSKPEEMKAEFEAETKPGSVAKPEEIRAKSEGTPAEDFPASSETPNV